MTDDGDPRVLLVDDEPEVLELYTEMLEETYAVDAVASGEAALDHLSASIDVVLLDRRMPDMSGDEVLEVIRERGMDCRVAMVTAIEPEFDIVDMGFDDYVVKPVTGSKLRNVVDSLLRWDEYDDVLKEYFRVARKVAVLEEENPAEELEENDDFRRLERRLSALKDEADDVFDRTDTELFDVVIDSTGDETDTDPSADPAEFSS